MQPLDTDELQNVEKSMLYERFAETLLAYLCQQVSHRQDAEDLLLEVFLAALQNTSLARFPTMRQLAWLRRVARNKVIDHYRHRALFTIQSLGQAQEMEDEGYFDSSSDHWTSLSTTVLYEPTCPTTHLHWKYIVSAPGYSIVSGSQIA